jgi:hypothetical protein
MKIMNLAFPIQWPVLLVGFLLRSNNAWVASLALAMTAVGIIVLI